MSSSSIEVPGRVLRALESDRADRKSAEHDGHRFDVVRPPKARRRARRGERVQNEVKTSRLERVPLAHKAAPHLAVDYVLSDDASHDYDLARDEDGRESGAEHDS